MSNYTGFFHNVYIWLREDGESGDAGALIAATRKYLPGIPGVLRLVAAAPAGTPHPLVEGGYAIALLMEFADQASHDAYESHPDHVSFVEECKHLWSRVQVYNFSPVVE